MTLCLQDTGDGQGWYLVNAEWAARSDSGACGSPVGNLRVETADLTELKREHCDIVVVHSGSGVLTLRLQHLGPSLLFFSQWMSVY